MGVHPRPPAERPDESKFHQVGAARGRRVQVRAVGQGGQDVGGAEAESKDDLREAVESDALLLQEQGASARLWPAIGLQVWPQRHGLDESDDGRQWRRQRYSLHNERSCGARTLLATRGLLRLFVLVSVGLFNFMLILRRELAHFQPQPPQASQQLSDESVAAATTTTTTTTRLDSRDNHLLDTRMSVSELTRSD